MSNQTPPSSKAPALRRLALRITSFLAGAAILFHEVWITKDSEPILDLIALYLMGVPTADLMTHIKQTLGSESPSRKPDDEKK